MIGSWFARRRARACAAEGSAALDRGDDDLALCWFAAAVRIDPRSVLGRLGCGLVRLRKGEFNVAIAELSEAIRVGGDPRAYFLRSLCYEGKGDHGRQSADRREALRRDPLVARTMNYSETTFARPVTPLERTHESGHRVRGLARRHERAVVGGESCPPEPTSGRAGPEAGDQ